MERLPKAPTRRNKNCIGSRGLRADRFYPAANHSPAAGPQSPRRRTSAPDSEISRPRPDVPSAASHSAWSAMITVRIIKIAPLVKRMKDNIRLGFRWSLNSTNCSCHRVHVRGFPRSSVRRSRSSRRASVTVPDRAVGGGRCQALLASWRRHHPVRWPGCTPSSRQSHRHGPASRSGLLVGVVDDGQPEPADENSGEAGKHDPSESAQEAALARVVA